MSVSLTIDGTRFGDLNSFYKHMDELLTDGTMRVGHNLDAFNDLLRGGFGVFDYGEQVDIYWDSFEQSRETLGDGLLLTILEIILRADNCTLHISE